MTLVDIDHCTMNQRYQRRPEHDRRIGRGDDFAGDAYEDATTGAIVWVAVGVDPNAKMIEGQGK